MRFKPLLTLLLSGALVACRTAPPPPPPSATAQASLPETPPPPAPGSTLGAGDVLEVRVYEEPDQSGAWKLSAEGTIDYPLCGKVMLAGHTSSTAADVLRECLGRWLRSPQVSVLIREYTSKKVSVLGEVQKPGTFAYEEGITIIEAFALAGGFNKLAQKNGIFVTRRVDGEDRHVRVAVEDIGEGRASNFLLRPGDTVYVPESLF